MIINLFDIDNNKAVPAQACYIVPWLFKIQELFPEDYLKVYSYIFFMTCPDSTNPYVNLPEEDKEEVILSDLAPINFSLEDEYIQMVMERCKHLYATPVTRSFIGAKKMLDKIGRYLDRETIVDGKEGNAMTIKTFMKELPDYWENYKKLETILKEEQSKVRGDKAIPYWQKDDHKESRNYE